MVGTQRSRVWWVHSYSTSSNICMTHDGVAKEHPHAGHVVSVEARLCPCWRLSRSEHLHHYANA